MSLTQGQKLGHFEIVEPIGKGGMGEVYRARDTKLGRDVAIKVLPQDFLDDAERVARFEREARLLAALNHPNIATIHGIEESDNQQFLVMELVEGETLAERIARGAISLGEALPLFEQIARGLEAAHEKSVIHRDLKPPNIIVSPDGTPKLLDFGLAKAYLGDTAEIGLSQSPTLSRGTAAGVILGTAPYMSPEQARGKTLDKRTDIWAFGCCFYEALTGKPAFMGETVTDTIAKIVEREPDWSSLPRRTPARIHELLRRCLQKDSRERVRDIGDARIEIRTALSTPEEIPPSSETDSWSRKGLAIVGSLLAGVVVATVFVSHWTPSPDATVVRFGIPLAPTDQLSDPYGRTVAFSPTGSHIAYAANGRLYLRGIDQFNATELLGSEGAEFPFFSPDGRSIGFFADGEIKRLSILGGDPLTLCAADDADAFDRSASWGPDDTIVFVTGRASVPRVSAGGGTPELLAEVDVEAGERARNPQLSPDGSALLFTVGSPGDFANAYVVAQSIETGERQILLEVGADARYVPSGHLVFARGETLLAVRFDWDRLEISNRAVPVANNVRPVRYPNNALTGTWQFSVSDVGSLVFVPNSAQGLVWVDREGRLEPVQAPADDYYYPRVSPRGDRVAYVSQSDIWVYNIRRSTAFRLTFTEDNNWPTWTPDATRVIFSSSREGAENLFSRNADGSGDALLLTTSDRRQRPESISPDGTVLTYREMEPTGGWDIWKLRLDGDDAPVPFRATRFQEYGTVFSPDGRWIAYTSNESGQYEVYVVPFSGAGSKTLVSQGGGGGPVWARDGRELFYNTGKAMMVVSIAGEEVLTIGSPRALFESDNLGDVVANYDVTPDGDRFLIVRSTEPVTELRVVLNWTEELKRLVPVD